MRGLSAVVRWRVATAMAVLGAVILLAGPVGTMGQWADHCEHHFGVTHIELLAAFLVGAVAYFVGYDYEEDRVRIGQILGGIGAVGSVVTYLVLVGRGCGS
jgi:hypothetical protein